jgi:glycosyltransferase involved in cell wall biosynthesis
MRVALVNHTGDISGAEVSLLGAATALVQCGVQVVLVAPAAGELAERARAVGHSVETVALPAPRMTGNPIRLARGSAALVAGAGRLAAVLRRQRVDLVHANSVRAGLMTSFGRPTHRRPVVWSVRDFIPVNAVGLAVRFAAGLGATTIVGNSDAISQHFGRWPWLRRRMRTVYPGVGPEAFSDGSSNFRGAWRIPSSAPLVGCVGQITPWKNVHRVIAAFRVVAGQSPEARLVIVGAPKFRAENRQYLDELRRLVAAAGLDERVVFAGHQEDIEAVFRSIDVLAHAADREPFGRVLVEAMAQRVPVVASADGGVPEIVQEGETGFLVPPGDVDAMAARVLRLIRDPGLRRRLGAAGRDRAVRQFRADQGAAQLVEVYREVMARG